MSNIKLYCLTSLEYDILPNEKASTTNRGLVRGLWRRAYGELTITILTLHKNVRNTFMGWHD